MPQIWPTQKFWLDAPYAGIVSSRNAWERRSQSYFGSGNGVSRKAIVR